MEARYEGAGAIMNDQIKSYWFVSLSSGKPPIAMFADVKDAQAWRNEHYPDAKIEKFELILEF